SATAEYPRSESSVEPVAQFVYRAPDSHIGTGPDFPDRNALISGGGEIFGIEAAIPIALVKEMKALLKDHLGLGFELRGKNQAGCYHYVRIAEASANPP